MLKNIFAAIGFIVTAIKGYELYEKYSDTINENEFLKRQNQQHHQDPK